MEDSRFNLNNKKQNKNIMLYKALYLPVDKPLEDGCDAVDQNGEHCVYDISCITLGRDKFLRRAELFLVHYEYNTMIMVGKPSPEAKWLKNGSDVKSVDCHPAGLINGNWHKIADGVVANPYAPNIYWRIKCPMCQQLH